MCVCVRDTQYMSVRAWNECVFSNVHENIPLHMNCALYQINYYYCYYKVDAFLGGDSEVEPLDIDQHTDGD